MGNIVTRHNLSENAWTLEGYTPYLWQLSGEAARTSAEVRALPAKVPGSVQQTLLDHGVIEDWLLGNASRDMEWVENRQWVYQTTLNGALRKPGQRVRLLCDGLDYAGWVYLNGKLLGEFHNTHLDYQFELTGAWVEGDNQLAIVFDLPPRWLGQFGYSSRMDAWKTRYNYTWDWVIRLVQTGIWGPIALEVSDGNRLRRASCAADYDLATQTGTLTLYGGVEGSAGAAVRVTVLDGDRPLASAAYSRAAYLQNPVLAGLSVAPWQPNGLGDQPLYQVRYELLDAEGDALDQLEHTVGFKHVEWRACEGAPKEADPWLCVVNGQPVFLQGVNFQPIRANFADVDAAEYERRIRAYAELGVNAVRINACGYLELPCFFELCDRYGIMVWQEFPLTSSGIENLPPRAPKAIEEMLEVVASFIERRRHHASLLIWCGANELYDRVEEPDGIKSVPCAPQEPMLKRIGELCRAYDPHHRYVHVSPSGPREFAERAEFGRGLNWDVHGPYNSFDSSEEERDYWAHDDALFRSELCCPGANPIDLMQAYSGGQPLWPADKTNPYWCRPVDWWVDIERLAAFYGRAPESLEAYVALSQKHQADTLAYAMKQCKQRFPAMGGALLWGSHDTFPQPANTSILDFWGRPKPAAIALGKVWRGEPD